MPLPFPHPTTLGNASTPHADSSQVNLSFAFKSESRLLNMTQSLLCYRVLTVSGTYDAVGRISCSRWTFHMAAATSSRLLGAIYKSSQCAFIWYNACIISIDWWGIGAKWAKTPTSMLLSENYQSPHILSLESPQTMVLEQNCLTWCTQSIS
jgi:hypothetical protein